MSTGTRPGPATPRKRLTNAQLECLPPTLALLFREAQAAKPRLSDRGFIRDLRKNAAYSVDHWTWAEDRPRAEPGSHLIAPGESFNPFSNFLRCSGVSCRLSGLEAFGRFVALYTDGAIMRDPLTDVLILADDDVIPSAIVNSLVAGELISLLERDLIRFSKPVKGGCEECRRISEEEPIRLAKALVAANRDSFKVFRDQVGEFAGLRVDHPELFTTPTDSVSLGLPLTSESRRRLEEISPTTDASMLQPLPAAGLELVEEMLTDHFRYVFHGLMWQGGVAEATGATLFAGCRAETFALREGEPVASREGVHLPLPWLDRLSLAQALEVRDKCGPSLVALRRRLAVAKEATTTWPLAAELRADADEVERALEPRRWRQIQDALLLPAGISLALSASGSTLTGALAGLLGAAVNLRSQADTEHRSHLMTKARPGYAVLEARNLLATHENH